MDRKGTKTKLRDVIIQRKTRSTIHITEIPPNDDRKSVLPLRTPKEESIT